MAEVDEEKFLSDRGFQRLIKAGKVVYHTPGPMPGILHKRDQVENYLKREKRMAGKPM